MIKKPEPKPTICPRCGYLEATRKGTRTHVSGESVARYQCKKCNYKFTQTQIKAVSKGKKHQTGKTIVDLDKPREAKKPGKRIVIHKDKNGKEYTTVYWEFRRNRSDIDPKKRL